MRLDVKFSENTQVFKSQFGEVQKVTEYVGGLPYTAGDHINITPEGKISVLTADEVETDNTRPVTSAAVATQVGNIEILLKTI